MSEELLATCEKCGQPALADDGVCRHCGARAPWAADAPDPLIGALVGGRFRVASLLGEGGIGRVYEAVQEALDRPVALKVLHPEYSAHETMNARFHREARNASKLDHPGSVIVHDFGQWEGRLYIAMELLSGVDLCSQLVPAVPFERQRMADVLDQLFDVLTAAHDIGLLHRDLKPENVMLLPGKDGGDHVKVVDFGLAIVLSERERTRLTEAGEATGTPEYMSPEQVRGEEADARSDLYAVGVMLYELLCGYLPFDGQTAMEIMIQHLYQDPLPPSKRVAPGYTVDRALEELALSALAKNPLDRPQTAAEFRERLQPALAHDPTDDTRSGTVLSSGSRAARAAAAGLERPAPGHHAAPVPGELPPLVLVETVDEAAFSTSVTATLRASGQRVAVRVDELAEAVDALPGLPGAVLVVDLGSSPDSRLASVAEAVDAGKVAASDVILVGPDEAMEAMTRAIQLGMADYVPRSTLSRKLAKALKRITRRRQREAG